MSFLPSQITRHFLIDLQFYFSGLFPGVTLNQAETGKFILMNDLTCRTGHTDFKEK